MMTAIAAQPEVRRAAGIRLPGGNGDGDRRAQINPQFVTPVYAVEQDDQDQSVNVEIGDLPRGTRELYVQHRMCGDFYCFIGAERQVAAVGGTPREAFANALRKAA